MVKGFDCAAGTDVLSMVTRPDASPLREYIL